MVLLRLCQRTLSRTPASAAIPQFYRNFNMNSLGYYRFSSTPPQQPQSSTEKSTDQHTRTIKKSSYQQRLETKFSADKVREVQSAMQEVKNRVYSTQLALRNDPKGTDFSYPGDTLISMNIKSSPLKDSPRQMLVMTSIWGIIGFALQNFVHSALIYPPAILGFTSLFQFLTRRRYIRKTIEKIEFVPHEIEKVNIYFVKNSNPILCYVDSIEIVDVVDDPNEIISPFAAQVDKKKAKVTKETESEDEEDATATSTKPTANNAQFTINFRDVEGFEYFAHNLFVFQDPNVTTVANFNLLTTVLNGDVVRLNKFKIVDTLPDSFIDEMFSGIETKKQIQQPQLDDTTTSSQATLQIEQTSDPTSPLQQSASQTSATELEKEIEQEIEQEIARFQKKSPKK